MTDAAGNLTGTADYDVFGAVRSSGGAGSVCGYTGEQLDSETASYYNPYTNTYSGGRQDLSHPPLDLSW